MAKKRVVVTGMGLTSCFGSNIDSFYDRLLTGESGVAPITEFRVEDFPTRFAAWVQDFEPGDYVDHKLRRRGDPIVDYTVYAGKRAVEDAGLTGAELNKERCGIIVGSGMGGMRKYYNGVCMLEDKGVRRVSPFFVPYIITNAGGATLAIDLGYKGPNYSVSTACATGSFSIINAANHIRMGDADLMVCGGVEATQNRMTLGGFVACRALSERNDDPTRASRPWDKGRDGFVLGEGCGVLILESLDHALARGAKIYAEYLGGGLSCDAYHITMGPQNGSGIAQAIDSAIRDAEISKERVNYINAHATSTVIGDASEAAGVRMAFGDHCKNIKMNATKSMIGHALGGAAGIEAVVTVMAMRRGELHPTINQDDPEDIGIDVCPNAAQKYEVDVALKNSFGFGGHNASILFGQYVD